MVRLASLAATLAALSAASALRVKSLTHSGPGCPQDAKVTWSDGGSLDDLTVTLSDFSATLAQGQMTTCQVHILLEQGEAGRALSLQDVVVRGGLYMSANARVDFLTTAYWSETASDTVTKQSTTTSGASASVRNVAVAQRLGAASTCVGSDGYVGILNVTFRIISQAGSRVVFGRERKDSGTAPVTERLTFAWQGC
ncbi:secreted protein [Colletotrichum musicola]|uniref:Secreted protein n=1 Tax=Colletotrichum musicola TaxID=2175873 RepID=A0A8H6MLW6_9PEZI|nr:secreted protein [Colletotrichum musicola]